MLKLYLSAAVELSGKQPPSGGCVLKHLAHLLLWAGLRAAAFGRLCVETTNNTFSNARKSAAAFGRLCVETWIP